jgi:ATP-dependent Lhr-like helicase
VADVLRGIQSRQIRVVSVETQSASPFASGLLFNWVMAYMYEGDAPLAERRAQALALDRELLAELLGEEELRELLDPAALADLELELQGLVGGRRVRTVDGVHDLLRRVGDLRSDEVAARADLADPLAALGTLEGDRRIAPLRLGGESRWIGIEDVARYRDAVGASPPAGVAGSRERRARSARWAAAAMGQDPRPVHGGRPGRTLGGRHRARQRAAARPGRVRRAGRRVVPPR